MSVKHLTAHSGFTHSHPQLPAVTARVCACFPAPSLLPQLPLDGGMAWAGTAAPLPAHVRVGMRWGTGNNVDKAQSNGSVTKHGWDCWRGTRSTDQASLELSCWWNHLIPELCFAQSCWEWWGSQSLTFRLTQPASHQFIQPKHESAIWNFSPEEFPTVLQKTVPPPCLVVTDKEPPADPPRVSMSVTLSRQ